MYKRQDKDKWPNMQSLMLFRTKLGPSLLQLGKNFSPKAIPELKSYLSLLPEHFNLFIELWHKGWFMPDTMNEVIKLFKSHGKGFAITDTPGRRVVLHMNLTTPHAFIRFSASGDTAIDKQRLDFWKEKINHWKKLRLKSIGFCVSHANPRYEPVLCEYLKNKNFRKAKSVGINRYPLYYNTSLSMASCL